MGPHLEAGDAFPWRDRLLVGHGPRTDRAALDQLADLLHVGVDGVEIAHPGMYHLDLAFCPLDDRTALVCPDAFEPASATGLLARVPDPIVLTEQEALTFCANSIVVADTVVMPACPRRIRQEIERRGFEVVLVDVSELHKGGGSVRCLTNPLDIALGRDLADLPGGEVRLL
jgi:N-dimethylarginine dimethylaminohydrolase